MKYPEGWAQSGSGPSATFSETRTTSSASSSGTGPLRRRRRFARPCAEGRRGSGAPRRSTVSRRAAAIKVVYTTESAPNPVTGKRVTLVVDRYYLCARRARRAVVDLGTPQGVDNVDAYRLMIESFRWR